MKRQKTVRKTIAQIMMEHPPTGRRDPRPAHTPAPAATRPAKAAPPVVDAMSLTPEDFRRRLAQLGLSLPADAETPYRPMGRNEVEHQRAREQSSRVVERAGQAIAAERQHAESQRTDELQPGSFDARTATPEQVRARYAQLGLDVSPVNLHVADVGRQLEARRQVDASHAATAQRERDREVARHAHEAIRRGDRFDVKKLSAAEFAALMELRGSGGYEPVR